MKNFLLVFFLLIININFSFSASSGSNENSNHKTNYEKAVSLIKAAKKYEKKGKVEKAEKRYQKAQKLLIKANKKNPKNADTLIWNRKLRKINNFILQNIHKEISIIDNLL